jgi:GT2 family glycosyltransferase
VGAAGGGARGPAGAPAVSIVVPTYQRRALVRRAVASVLAQTRAQFEVIVVDDGSTDGTREALADLDERVRCVWQPNRGVAAARNVGIGLARAPIVAFLDSDNTWLPDHLETITAVLERFPRAVLVSTCPRGVIAGRDAVERARLVEVLPDAVGQVGFISGVAVRRAALEAVGRFDERLRVGEDRDLWLQLSLRGPFALLRRRTIVRQSTRGSLWEWGLRSGAYLDAFELSTRRAIRALEGLGTAPARDLLDRMQGRLHFVAALRALVDQDDPRVREALREACRLMPGLSDRPSHVLRAITMVPAGAPAERARHVTAFATHWPDPRADAALLLRGWAVLVALRLGRPRQAAALLRDWPLAATPRFLVRVAPVLARRLRRVLYAARHRG